jgi:hypothetical protein
MSLFNLFDTFGRYIGGDEKFFISLRSYYINSWLRFIHIAVFILFSFFEDSMAFIKTPTGDALKILNLALFSFSNGYL